MKILGIESSHDDTSISLVENLDVIIHLKISQVDIHKKYGGTIPEIASREHYNNFYILLEELKKQFDLNDLDYISYTEEPGFIGALQMGKLFAHSLSKTLKKPLIPINHLDGHIYSVLLDNENKITYPAIALIASGGHTNLYLLNSKEDKKIIGQTIDDAVGEVFDKVSRILFNVFPGGPYIDQIFDSKFNNAQMYKLNDAKLKNPFDFSFSGYKTQIFNMSKNENIDKELLACSFQKQVIDFIISKTKLAIEKFNPKTIILSGGVSANKYLRQEFLKLHKNALIPKLEYATDNGAMIAAAAFEKLKNKN